MTCTNVILAQPEVGSVVNYDLPEGQSANLSFGPGDINGISLTEDGGLQISFIQGGTLVINNFEDIVDSGNLLYLSDGTMVDPRLLESGLVKPVSQPQEHDDIMISMPADGVVHEVTLQPGQSYVFNFDLNAPQEAYVKDGQFVMSFENGGKIVLANYEEAMTMANAPELSMGDSACTVLGQDLVFTLEQLALGLPVDGITDEEQEAQEKSAHKSEIADADLQGQEAQGDQPATAQDAANVEPAVGDEQTTEDQEDQQVADAMAEELAEIDPAAGETAVAARNSGYGYNSSASNIVLSSPDAVGPLGATILNYNAPSFVPEVSLIDDIPAVTNPPLNVLDESDLDGGPLIATGKLIVDYGVDAPGDIHPNGFVSFTGSVAGGSLTSGGVPVLVTQTATGYVGMAGTVTVFTFTINPQTGNYTYTQTAPFDHADANDANDTITVNIGVEATDNDGDSVAALIRIRVADDAPEASDATNSVDETDIGLAAASVTGQVDHDFGSDDNGTIAGTGGFSATGSMMGGNLTHSGVPVTVALVGDTYIGTAGGETIFTLQINNDGTYTFNLLSTLDHGDPNDPNDIIVLNFGARVTDYDGDHADSTIHIHVKDDVPTIGNSTGDVDETYLSGGPLVYTDTLIASFGVETGSIQADGNFNAQASGTPLTLTSGGVAVVVTQTANGYVGMAGGEVVFTLEVNSTTGAYTYTQLLPLDHPDTSDHNDVISLQFGVEVESFDGDTAHATITIDVGDDGVDARNDFSGAEEDQFITGNLLHNDFLGQDNPNAVSDVTFNGTTYTVPNGGSATITAAFGTFIINSDGTYSYQATAEDPDGTEVFTYTLRDGDGDTDTATLNIRVTPDGEPVAVTGEGLADETNLDTGPVVFNGQLDIDAGRDGFGGVSTNGQFSYGDSVMAGILSHNGTPVTVSMAGNVYTGMAGGLIVFTLTVNTDGSYRFELLETLDHANALDPNDALQLDFGVTLSDVDGDTTDGTITIHVLDDAPVAYDDWSGVEEDGFISGNVTHNDELSEDNTNIVAKVIFDGTTYNVPATGVATINGQYGTFTMDHTGVWTYQATAEDPDGHELFTYVLKDSDGDENIAQLDIHVTPDGEPVAVTGEGIVDETNLDTGPVVTQGDLAIDAGVDGYGGVQANGSFNATGSLTSLTHHGVAVNVTNTATGYVGMAGNVKIFDLQLHQDGTYTFTLFDTIDHANPLDPNDAILLNFEFGVTAIDSDGDTVDGTLSITVLDDAPVAYDDWSGVEEDGFISGNVIQNDELSEDDGNIVTKVVFEGTTYNVPATGVATITGQYGTFTMAQTGVWTYQATAEDPDGHELFKYTLADFEGDADTAVLDIRVTPDGEPIAISGEGIVDESNLIHGPVVTQGDLAVDYGVDGIGSIQMTGSFEASGSLTSLTHKGIPVVVTATPDGYVGMAGNEMIFQLDVHQNGAYEFTLFETLDHANPLDPNDNIKLDFEFGVMAIDSDGDTVEGTLTINVLDDAPVARDDMFCVESGTSDDTPVVVDSVNSVDETNGFDTVSGRADVNYFEDGPGTVSGTGDFSSSYALTSHGQPVTVTLNGNTYTGKAGGQTIFTLTVQANGTYTFTQLQALDHANQSNPNDFVELNFGIKATDSDGDIGDGSIKINVYDDGPVAHNDWLGSYTYTGDDVQSTTLSGNLITGAGGGGNAGYYPWGVSGVQADTVGADSPGTITSFTFQGLTATIPAGGSATISAHIWDWGDSNLQLFPALGGSHSDDDLVITVHSDGSYYITGAEKWPGQIAELTYTLTDYDGDTSSAKAGWYTYISPLVLDLDGDGIELVGTNQGVYFDMNVDGHVMDKTAWAGPDDGLLAIDANNDGRITDRSELFGDTGGFSDGFANLASYDTNHDGKITAADADFGKLLVWKDANTDGVSQEGEMYSLSQLGITSINVANTDVSDYYINGQLITHESTFTMNGDTRTIVDAWFQTEIGDDIAGPNADPNLNGVSTTNTIHASVLHNDSLSADDANTITAVVFGGTTYNIASGGSVMINGQYGVLVMNSDGTFTYTANNNISSDQVDVFTYHLTDSEGDTDTAELSICVKADDIPEILEIPVGVVDETGGFDTVSGTVNVDYGHDGPGTVAGTGSFSSSYALKSGGQSVAVTLSGDTYMGTAGGQTVFTLTVNGDGTYTFQQYKALDHASASDANDSLDLVFGIKATDIDGDTDEGNIRIRVFDDGPNAVDDGTKNVAENASVSGNVTSNDQVGADGAGVVTKVVFGGTTYNVPTTGNLTVNGTYGVLNISATGAYSYTAKNNANGTDSFTYTLRDFDGDTDTANISFHATGVDDQPVIVNGYNQVDETGGFDTVSGTVSVNYGGDGPGVVAANGGFSSSYSLTSGGVAVSVTQSGNTYTGAAGGQTVFTLKVNADGTYTFQQYKALDHANTADANDSLDLVFGIKATDADGDVGNGNIRIRVFDDGPQAVNDGQKSLGQTGDKVSGNVLSNDNFGLDGAGHGVTHVVYNGTTYDISPGGTVTIGTSFGNMIINSNGNWTFDRDNPTSTTTSIRTSRTIGSGEDSSIERGTETTTTTTWKGGTANFTYVTEDKDGDETSATFSVKADPFSSTTTSYTPDQPMDGDGGGDGDGGSPLIIDLDRDGHIELTSMDDGVLFDLGPDGLMDQVAWVQADDAFLGIDLNNDGIINGHEELFGQLDMDGFNVLALYNSNGDGVIDAHDDAWGQIVAWSDVNQDGVSQANEIFTMDQLGIVGINLTVVATEGYIEGSYIPYEGTFVYSDGSEGIIVDAWLQYSKTDIVDESYDPNADIGGVTGTGLETIDDGENDVPVVIGQVEKALEKDLSGGIVTVSEKVTVFYGNDAPGETRFTGGFNASESLLNGQLSHNGVPVTVTFDVATQTFVAMAGSLLVFDMRMVDNGDFTFHLYQTLDHASLEGGKEKIVLAFDVVATDGDGDSTDGVVRIQVQDDDATSVTQDTSVTSNVVDDPAILGGDEHTIDTQPVDNGVTDDVPLFSEEDEYTILPQSVDGNGSEYTTEHPVADDGNLGGDAVIAVPQVVPQDGADIQLFAEDGAADQFLFTAIGEAVTTIHNFNAMEGDSVDISALLSGHEDDSVSHSIGDFVQMREESGDTVLSVADNGTGEMHDAVRLENVSDVDLSTLIDHSNIVVDS